MSRPRSVVPSVESLEGRVVLSRAGTLPVALGALGDSYTEPYRSHPPDRSHAMNWVEILSATRRASFGPTRGGALAFDWARSDASSTDVVQNQLPGLAGQVASGRVRDSVLFFGGIDYLNYAESLATTTSAARDPAQVALGVEHVTNTASVNFDKAVLTLLSANPNARLVVATLPTFTILPIVHSASFLPGFDVALATIEQGRQAYNDHIRLVAAASDRVALADLDGVVSPIAAIPDARLPYADTTIEVATPGDSGRELFLADGIHPGTVAQGIIANSILDAYRGEFGVQVPALGEGLVLRLAARAARSAR